MASKLPPKPAAPYPKTLPRVSENNATQQNPAPKRTPFLVTETFRKRRSVVWAVGIAIVVGSGVLIGAQLKETRQASERQNVQGQEQVTEVIPAREKDKTVTGAPDSQKVNATTNGSGVDGTDARGASYQQRQIAYLEDRRGVLMKQKFDLEQKIERVRDKKKREEDVERRRSVGIGAGAER